MKIFVGADHNGYALKADLIAYLVERGHDVIDEGDKDLVVDDDFPRFAVKVVSSVLSDDDNNARGILICASGQGMAIAANRFKGIRASLVWDTHEARMARNDDDSNILVLPSRVISRSDSKAVVDTWLETPFAEAPRFKRRIKELDNLG